MIGIPYILFLGLIEAVVVFFCAALFYWLRNRKLKRALAVKPALQSVAEPAAVVPLEAVPAVEEVPAIEDVAADEEVPAIQDEPVEAEETMLDLDGSMREDAVPEVQFTLPGSALELLTQRNQALSDAIGMIAVVIESSPDQLHELDALLRASDEMTSAIAMIAASPDGSVRMPDMEPVEEPFAAEPGSDFEVPPDIEVETVEDDVDATDHTLQDIILMSSLQVRILKEQREKLHSVLAGDSSSMESDRKILGAITALERENAALRRIAEELEQSGGAPGGGEELSSARIEIANLRDELKKAQNEIKSLEHEYDVLYSKSAEIAGGDSMM